MWRYVNTCRLYFAVIKALLVHLQWTVFESNTPILWHRITDTLTSILDSFHLDGFLKGASSREAYFVQCDEELNPPEVIDRGIVLIRVGLALVFPSEFIVVTFRRDLSGITIAEE